MTFALDFQTIAAGLIGCYTIGWAAGLGFYLFRRLAWNSTN